MKRQQFSSWLMIVKLPVEFSKGGIMPRVLKTSKNILIQGEANFTILKGKASIFKAKIGGGDKLHVLPGRTLPLVNQGNILELKIEGSKGYRLTSKSIFPNDWHRALKNIEKLIERKKRPKILIMGGTDTGKSSFTIFLANYLLRREKKIGIIDADIGQSKIGPPGVIGAGITSAPILSLYELEIAKGYFVGDKSPTGHLLPMICGIKTLSEYLEDRVSGVLVDTTGMIFGGAARALKKHKIEIMRPVLVVTLEENKEMEHIIRGSPNQRFIRLPVPEEIKPLNREKRIKLRNLRFKNLSKSSCSEISLDLRQTPIQQSLLRNGQVLPRKFHPKEATWIELSAEGLLIITHRGLNEFHKQETVNKVKKTIQTLQGIRSLKNAEILEGIEKEKRTLLHLIKGVNPKDLRVSVLPSIFYDKFLIGLKKKGELYGIGRIQNVDFEKEVIHIEGYQFKGESERGKSFPRPTSISLGFLRFDEHWKEVGKRRTGTG